MLRQRHSAVNALCHLLDVVILDDPGSMITLRDYQSALVNRVFDLEQAGTRRICAVSPTGSGKTPVATEIIRKAREEGKRVMFWAHRKELIDQCCSKLEWAGLTRYGVIKSGHERYDPTMPIQVASVQTLIRRDHWPADVIIIDECHRSTAKTYINLIERYTNDPLILGFTATPYRDSGKPLGVMYDAIAEGPSVEYLIQEGFLKRPMVYGAESLDMKGLRVTAGDYNRQDLSDLMANTILRGDLVSNWKMRSLAAVGAEDLCTVVFAVSIEQSLAIMNQFLQAGIPARHLDGKTPDKKREQILDALRRRRIKVLCNVGICTEGWDLPHLECIVLARPTRSRSLYKQMIGRVMRPDPDKRAVLVLDHADCTRMHGFVYEAETYSLKTNEDRSRKKLEKRKTKDCPRCNAILPMFAQQCEQCEYVFTRDDKAREVGYTEEELKLLDEKDVKRKVLRADKEPIAKQQRDFNELCKTCVEKKYKPNWARMKFMTIYGRWPCWQFNIRTPAFFKEYEKKRKTEELLKKQEAEEKAAQEKAERKAQISLLAQGTQPAND